MRAVCLAYIDGSVTASSGLSLQAAAAAAAARDDIEDSSDDGGNQPLSAQRASGHSYPQACSGICRVAADADTCCSP